jgi:hypothetical protein
MPAWLPGPVRCPVCAPPPSVELIRDSAHGGRFFLARGPTYGVIFGMLTTVTLQVRGLLAGHCLARRPRRGRTPRGAATMTAASGMRVRTAWPRFVRCRGQQPPSPFRAPL